MAGTKNEKVSPWLWLIPIVFVVIGISFWKGKTTKPAASYPIVADAQDIWVHAGETVKVKIRPDCWSGWINLPANAYVAIDFPGEHEYLFVTGERILSKDKTTRWLGEVPRCSFRILGTAGEVTITIQPNQTPVSYY